MRAATPVVRSAGMIKYGKQQVFVVPEILGIDPAGLDSVTFFSDALYIGPVEHLVMKKYGLAPPRGLDPHDMAMRFTPRRRDGRVAKRQTRGLRGIVPGIEVYPVQQA